MTHVTSGARFDERRNSSRVFPVSPLAVDECRRTFERAARERPEWYAWVVDGCPELTTEEYVAYCKRSGKTPQRVPGRWVAP